VAKTTDDKFYDRADEHIELSNGQIEGDNRGKVSASMMYATARFNAWVVASAAKSGAEMKRDRKKALEYFVEQYRLMLEENLDDYSENYKTYMKAPKKKS
jgi:hypothetical protein